MIIRCVVESDLVSALAAVNVIFEDNIKFKRAEYISSSRGGGESWRVTLTVNNSRAPGSRVAVGYNAGRRIAAACWHVYGFFMDFLPDEAIIIASGVKSRPGDRWVDRNIGSTYYPGWYSESCDCSTSDLTFPLPAVFWSSDYNEPMIVVDNWAEHDRIERIIKGMASDGMRCPVLEWRDPHNPDHVESFEAGRVELGFSDEYRHCDICFSYIVRTSPDSYSWQLSGYNFEDGKLACSDCMDNDEDLKMDLLQEHVNANKLLNDSIIDPSVNGWSMLQDPVYPGDNWRFANGMHPGQSDSPALQIEVLNAAGIDCLFTGFVQQFDVHWYVWVQDGFEAVAVRVLQSSYHGLGYDPAAEMAKVLKGGRSDHYTMTTRTISPDEFVKGIGK